MPKVVNTLSNKGQGKKSPEIKGIARRDFLKFCTINCCNTWITDKYGRQAIADTIINNKRPPVIWLHFQECTGCTESHVLRATHPTVEHLILDLISLDYSETLMVGAGHQAEDALHKSVTENEGKFILVVEGSIPTKDDGVYCKIGGKTALSILKDIAPKGSCNCCSWFLCFMGWFTVFQTKSLQMQKEFLKLSLTNQL